MILRDIVNLFRQLFASLFGERRNWNAHELAIVGRVETEISSTNCFFNCANLRLIPWLDGEHLWFGSVNRSQLAERRHGAVIIDQDRIEQANSGSPVRTVASFA